MTIDNEKNAAIINIHAGSCSSTTIFDYKHVSSNVLYSSRVDFYRVEGQPFIMHLNSRIYPCNSFRISLLLLFPFLIKKLMRQEIYKLAWSFQGGSMMMLAHYRLRKCLEEWLKSRARPGTQALKNICQRCEWSRASSNIKNSAEREQSRNKQSQKSRNPEQLHI